MTMDKISDQIKIYEALDIINEPENDTYSIRLRLTKIYEKIDNIDKIKDIYRALMRVIRARKLKELSVYFDSVGISDEMINGIAALYATLSTDIQNRGIELKFLLEIEYRDKVYQVIRDKKIVRRCMKEYRIESSILPSVNILVSNELSISYVSSDKTWETIRKIVEDKPKDKVVIVDLNGITIIPSGIQESFRKLAILPNVTLMIYDCEEAVGTASIISYSRYQGLGALVVACKTERNNTYLSKESKAEKNRASKVELEKSRVKIDNEGNAVYKPEYTQISGKNTVDLMHDAILDIEGLKSIKLDFSEVTIITSIMEYLVTKFIQQLELRGINVEIESTEKDKISGIMLYYNIRIDQLDTVEKKLGFIKKIRIGTPSRLAGYKKTRSIDNLGRQGNGDEKYNVPAIYRGYKEIDGEVYIFIDRFYLQGKGSRDELTFTTKIDWRMKNDGSSEGHEIEFDSMKIPLKEIGMYGKFTGTKYELRSAVQYNNDGLLRIHRVIEDENRRKVIYTSITEPELMKAVFDDFGISYDAYSMKIIIDTTLRKLERKCWNEYI